MLVKERDGTRVRRSLSDIFCSSPYESPLSDSPHLALQYEAPSVQNRTSGREGSVVANIMRTLPCVHFGQSVGRSSMSGST